VERTTLNKDITNLKAFINWCRGNRYINEEIKIELLKEDERPVKFLSTIQIKSLLSSAMLYQPLWMCPFSLRDRPKTRRHQIIECL